MTKKIKKIGVALKHVKTGFRANALCAWKVPQEKLDEIAKIMGNFQEVSHCYDRKTTNKDWDYNLYTMIHAKNRKICEEIIEQISHITGIKQYQVMYSKKEWKKATMKYFCE